MTSYSYRYFGTYRFVLAALVMVQHFAANAAPDDVTLAFRPLEIGSMAVLAFFCLSGYVIAEAVDVTYRNRVVAFLSNRFIRVFPHFAIALALSIALHAYFVSVGALSVEKGAPLPAWDVFSLANVLPNFILLPTVDRFISYNFLPIAWAVRVEVAFYLVVAIAIVLQQYVFRGRMGLRGALLVLALLLLPAFVMTVLHRAPALFGYMPYFAFGTAVFFAQKGGKISILVAVLAALGMAAHFYSLPSHHPTYGFERNVVAQGVLLTALLAAFLALSWIQGKRYERTDALIGRFTYPLYMYHYAFVMIFSSALGEATYLSFMLGMISAVAGSIAISYLLDPTIDRLRDVIRGHRVQATTAHGEKDSLPLTGKPAVARPAPVALSRPFQR
jgi:peptidoglycan/LPS O-acetylase OafA/YrhL